MADYIRFNPPHLLSEYRGKDGHEVGGLALSPMALDALAHSVGSKQAPELVVIGRYDYPDGRYYLDFGVPTAHIEAVSDWRWDPDAKKLRILCPECDQWDGKHKKSCNR